VWRRVWWLAAGLLAPPILGALVSGERALAVAPLFALAEVPLAALALWVFGAYLLLGYWMRRICFRLGVAGVVIYLLVRRFELVPRWMAEWPRTGGSLSLSPAEAAYSNVRTFPFPREHSERAHGARLRSPSTTIALSITAM
jgi:hypothetical protein